MRDGLILIFLHEEGWNVGAGRVVLLAKLHAGSRGDPMNKLVAIATLYGVGSL